MRGVTQPQDPSASVPSTTVDDVPGDATIIDVREDDEWAAGHAAGATHIPLGDVPARLDEVPDGPVYMICKSGGRSAQATAFLNHQGRTAVNVEGGTGAWAQAGRPMQAAGDAEPQVI